MSGLISYSELQQSAPLPVAIDYPAALALRQMPLIQGKLPKYLLAPEVSALHHYVPDLHRRMLLNRNASVRQKSKFLSIKLQSKEIPVGAELR